MNIQKRRFIRILLALLILTISVTAFSCSDEPEVIQPPSGSSDGAEVGVYYFDAGYDEYTLTLNREGSFALIVKGSSASGSYSLSGGALTLDFAAEGKENISATYADNVVSLVYEGASMRFLKKINYLVNFETNGGSSIPELTVVNGKTVNKPADPVRSGHLFVGWYTDSAFTAPFSFDGQPIGADTTLYARWSADPGENVNYTVKFDLNYENATSLPAVLTVGGGVFDLPIPTRSGFEFKGWWFSSENDGTKLSHRCENGTVVDANTTLYALWQAAPVGSKLPAPIVNVEKGSVSWNNVSGARSYEIEITNQSGSVVLKETTGNTTINVPFDAYAAGKYVIKVTANANSGAADNAETLRYYTNKPLRRVSIFNVIEPSVLNFNTVEHAERYLITVVCGDPNHKHTNFDNGSSRSFSFVNCPMTAEGIRFTVTAVADGYAPSTSETFVYKRALPAVEGLCVDESTQVAHWNEVPGASHYMVAVVCGDPAHQHGYVYNGTNCFVSLKNCKGSITVKVYPEAKGYIAPAAAECSFNKTNLPTPSDIVLNGTVLSWSSVDGATGGYEVKVGNEIKKTNELFFDIAALVGPVEGTEYAVSVRALGGSESLWSDPIRARYLEMSGAVIYGQNKLSWTPVIGADGYEVQIDNGEPIVVSGGVTSLGVTLTHAGVNVLRVRFVDGTFRSEWVTVEVYAHTVTFDARGGSEAGVCYVAVGDRIQLPTPQKTGYVFSGWYNVPGGSESNGLRYSDALYAETGSIVLYAYYTPTKVTVQYNYGNGGVGDKTSDLVSYDRHYTLTVPEAAVATGAFGGWFSAPYGMGVRYTDAQGNSLTPWDSLEEVELHAFWIDYALKFELTKLNGKDVYMVLAGDRIALVNEVTVPASFNGLPVAMVAGNAFKDCTSLKAIHLPSTLEQISLVDPFVGCTALEAIHVYDAKGNTAPRFWSQDGVLFDNGATSVAQPSLLVMPLGKTGSYRIPDGVVEVPENAFANSLISKIVIPASVTRIGRNAFYNSVLLSSVRFETAASAQSLTIAAGAFAYCSSLERITLPARLSEIVLTKYNLSGNTVGTVNVENAFLGCDALETINVESGNRTYKSVNGILFSADGKSLLYCPFTVAGAFQVPAGTQAIGAGAFIGCKGITEVVLPNSVTFVGDFAFYGLNTKLGKVTFSGNGFNDVTIGKNAFRACAALTEVVFASGSRVSVISEGAFYDCSNLLQFTVPATVTQIGSYAFSNCTSLGEVSFAPNGKKLSFGEGAFSGCSSLENVTLPANVSEIPGIFSGCMALQSVTVAADSPYFTAIDGVLFNKEETEILFFPQGKIGTYRLPSSVTSIAAGVFSYNTNLSKLVLPNTLTHIGDQAFQYSTIGEIVFEGDVFGESLTIGNEAFANTKVTALTLPKHTKTMGDKAFYGSNLRSITLNNGLENLGAEAFSLSYNLFDIDIPGSVKVIGDRCFVFTSIMEVALHEGLETIGKNAFENTYYLSSLTVPASVKVIDDHAFAGSWMTDITFASQSLLEIIGAHAFEKTAKITDITIPKNVTSIGAYAFKSSALQTVKFEEGGSADLVIGTPYRYTYRDTYTDTVVTEIHVGHVFDAVTTLKTVKLPARLVEIKEYSFYKAGSALTVSVEEDSRLTTIGAHCFAESSLTSITIPKSVKNLDPVVDDPNGLSYDRLGIGAYAFANCKSLSNVTFAAGNEGPLTIGAGAFEGTTSLQSITLPASIVPYESHSGKIISGLANGADVFKGATALVAVAFVDGGAYYDDFRGVVYNADMTELIFCPVGKTGTVAVPETVTRIYDRAFYKCTGVTGIVLRAGTADLTVGDEAFAYCSSLQSLTFPTNTVSLGAATFIHCTALRELTLSKNITEFDGSMIDNCPALESISVEDGNPNFYYESGALYSGDKTVLLMYPSSRADLTFTVLSTVVRIDPNAFRGNKKLQTVVLPAGLREIGANAFGNCLALVNVEIPAGVEMIGEGAFEGCSALSNLSFVQGGDAALVIANRAFADSGVKNLTLPARVTVLGNRVFAGSSLGTLDFATDSRLDSIGASVFEGSDLRSVVFPASLREMGVCTFKDCKQLANVAFAEGSQLKKLPAGTFYQSGIQEFTVPSGVTELENQEEGNFESYGVFQNCAALRIVRFADNSRCMLIGNKAFEDCVALQEIVIPASVSTIGYLAFCDCTSLASITLPITVTKMGHGLFYGCTALSNVVLNTMATELPVNMFYGCTALKSVHIPANVASIGENCFTNSGVEVFTVAADNKTYAALDGILYSKDLSEILLIPPKHNASRITIPKQLARIDTGAFQDLPYLREVYFEEGGTKKLTIGDYAFAYCYMLHTVSLPKRVESIGVSSFQNCSALMSITLPENLQEIGDYAFYYCNKLIEVFNKSSSLSIGAGREDNGHVAYYAKNVYTPQSGSSILHVDANGFVTATLTESNRPAYKYLIGYCGNERNLILPADFDAFYDRTFYRHLGIESIFIPAGAGASFMGVYVFQGCNKPLLLMGGSAKPAAWGTNSQWNPDSCAVVWGADGSAHTYTFVTNCDQTIAPITTIGMISLPNLTDRVGLYFGGWYDNPSFDGNAYAGQYYSAEKTTLYAKWVTLDDYVPPVGGGTSRDNAILIVPGYTYDLSLETAKQKIYFVFHSTTDDYYHVNVSGNGNAKLEVYRNDSEYLTQNALTADSTTGQIDQRLQLFREGNTYYIVISLTSGTGELEFTFTGPV